MGPACSFMQDMVHNIDVILPDCPNPVILECLVLEFNLAACGILLGNAFIYHGGLTGPDVIVEVPYHLCHSAIVSVGTPFRVRSPGLRMDLDKIAAVCFFQISRLKLMLEQNFDIINIGNRNLYKKCYIYFLIHCVVWVI